MSNGSNGSNDQTPPPKSIYGTVFVFGPTQVRMEIGPSSGTPIAHGETVLLSSPVETPFSPQSIEVECTPPGSFDKMKLSGMRLGQLDLSTYSPSTVSVSVFNSGSSSADDASIRVFVVGPEVVML